MLTVKLLLSLGLLIAASGLLVVLRASRLAAHLEFTDGVHPATWFIVALGALLLALGDLIAAIGIGRWLFLARGAAYSA